VIENNRYGMGTAVERASAGQALCQRGAAYGIPGQAVDGMDVIAVHAAGLDALDSIRGGNGPFILEMKTYRYRGHSMSDPAKYRSKEEVQRMRSEHDPINHLRALLIEKELADETSLREIDRTIKDVLGAAAAFAQDSPEPTADELYTDVLIET